MKRHSTTTLLEYGIENHKRDVTSTHDGYPSHGKWFKKMDTGFTCGDTHEVLRVRMIGDMPMIQRYEDYKGD